MKTSQELPMKNIVKANSVKSWATSTNVLITFRRGWMAFVEYRGWYGPFDTRKRAEDFLNNSEIHSQLPESSWYTIPELETGPVNIKTLGDLRNFMDKVKDLPDSTEIESPIWNVFMWSLERAEEKIYVRMDS